ncbi:hypothetical protein Tco_0578341 [Tanacetum coccineum]
MENANQSCSTSNREFLDPKKKQEIRSWLKDSRIVDSLDGLYLMRRSLKVLRKFHWMILGGRFNQLSHVSSPLLSKPVEY